MLGGMGGVHNNSNWSGRNLSGWDFSSSVLNNCDFTGSDIAGSNFSSAVLNNCSMQGANARGASFVAAVLNNCTLDNALVDGADFTGARLVFTSFEGVNLNSATGLNPTVAVFGDAGTPGTPGTSGFTGSTVVMTSSGSSHVTYSGGVTLNSNGISSMPFDPWLRIFNDGHSYRIECPGTNIRINGTYTFVNGSRFLWTSPVPPNSLTVATGRVSGSTYERTSYWDLAAGAWCEVNSADF